MNSDYLFVYGTLLKDVDNEMSKFLQQHAQFISKGYFNGKLYQVSWYPGAVISNNSSDRVYGHIYKLSNFNYTFKVLDAYEGIDYNNAKNNLFKRESVTAFLETDTEIKTWVYTYNLSTTHLRQIESGDFLKFSVDKF